MIKVQGLSKRFEELRAVDNISFEVARGELFGFLGPNGVGKTTTISMVSGLLQPDTGTVMLGEYNLWESPRQAPAARRQFRLTNRQLTPGPTPLPHRILPVSSPYPHRRYICPRL